MKPSVLAVEDSLEAQALIRIAIGGKYNVEFSDSGRAALDRLTHEQFDLIILDIQLPDYDGFELYQRMLEQGKMVREKPVIFLTARRDIPSMVTGLSLGAEDYIMKPFNPIELLARVDARIRKSARASSSSTLDFGALCLDTERMQIRVQQSGCGSAVALNPTPIEFRIIQKLAQAPGRVYSRRQLIEAVWGNGTFLEERTVDKHISSLRRKLGDLQTCVRTVGGVGYEFEVPKN